MSTVDIVRAWKDAEYRRSLSAAEQALLPEHPAGAIELADEELNRVAGGDLTDQLTTILGRTHEVLSVGCCSYNWMMLC